MKQTTTTSCFASVLWISTLLSRVFGQIPSTFPTNYSGVPSGDYGTDWQDYFEVTDPLPNVTAGSLPRNFAGSLSVNRAGHPNDTLFFWGFEKQNGSLTAAADGSNQEPWLIWLNGGPGSSSMIGLLLENGPLRINNDYSVMVNNFSWHQLADAFWVDQPVGTGYSSADSTGYINDEDQMGQDFVGFLTNLVKVFPSLATRPFYLLGESYAGTYIPYIVKTLFSTPNPPVKLRKFAIGDGTVASLAVFEESPVVSIIETYPQLINFDQDVFNYFKEQSHLCGYDYNLTYPQKEKFPSNPLPLPQNQLSPLLKQSTAKKSLSRQALRKNVARRSFPDPSTISAREEKRTTWKRDLTGRANGTIDPWYGCFLWQEMFDYAVNFTFPWNNGGFDPYDVPDALSPEAPMDASVFLNNNQTRQALHVPQDVHWAESVDYPFGSTTALRKGTNEFGDPSVEPMAFFDELLANASANGVAVVLFSGNDDSLVAHRGTEVTIQNTTWGSAGIQGFVFQPNTTWFLDNGTFGGLVHQERNLTYVLLDKAGHTVPFYVPEAAFVFAREFIFGDNTTGLFLTNSSDPNAIVGPSTSLTNDILPGQDVIFYGSGATVSSTVAPSATIASFRSFLATAAPGATAGSKSGALPFFSRGWKTAGALTFLTCCAVLL